VQVTQFFGTMYRVVMAVSSEGEPAVQTRNCIRSKFRLKQYFFGGRLI
jgi:hypothetical protein